VTELRKQAQRALCFLGVALFFGPDTAAQLDSYNIVRLHYGINRVDFNNDGREDLVLVARRGNFNAHSFDVVTFYSNDPQNEEGHLGIVPMFDKEEKEELTLEVSGGADCVLHDFRLLKPKRGNQAMLIIAARKWSESFYEENTVTFSYFKLERNTLGTPGRPILYFSLSEVRQARAKHCDVNEAFRSELGLDNYAQRNN
jgi:hypothetical protein